MASVISAGTTSGTSLNLSGDTSGVLQLASNGSTTALTIDTSQNVGIGTSSFSSRLSVTGSANIATFDGDATTSITLTGSSRSDIFLIDSGAATDQKRLTIRGDGGNFIFGVENDAVTVFTERMRINSSGRLLVGTTAETPGYGNTNTGQQLGGSSVSTFSRGATDFVIVCNQNTSDGGTRYLMQFRVSDVSVGNILSNGSNCTFNSTSDYRLKEDIAPLTNALNRVSQLKPVTYKWKLDGSAGEGFIAHELQAIVPECVNGKKDAVNKDGSIKAQSIDTSFLVATLTAAIQELKAELDATKAEVQALKGVA